MESTLENTAAAETDTQPENQNQEPAQGDNTRKLKFNEVELNDGRIASIRKPKGRDVRDASRLAPGANEMELGMALAAVATSIDGVAVIYEDFLELDLDDCYAVVNKYNAMSGKK